MVLMLTILIAIISVLLILIILIQNPKGGGLSSTFGGSQAAHQVIGAKNSTDLLEKVTWGLASALLLLCLASGVMFKSGDSTATNGGINIEKPVENIPANQPANGLPGDQPMPQPTK